MDKADIRTLDNSIRALNDDGKHIISGKAITFNETSSYMGFYEQIKPEAVKDIDWRSTLLLYNHDYANILARVDASNLDIDVRKDGVYFTAELPNTTLAIDVYEDIRAGNVKGCSFGFKVAPDGAEWSTTDDGEPFRTVTKIESVPELSLTPIPSYTKTSAMVVRSLEEFKKGRTKMPKDLKDEKLKEEMDEKKPIDAEPVDDESTDKDETKADEGKKQHENLLMQEIEKAFQQMKDEIKQLKDKAADAEGDKKDSVIKEERDSKPETESHDVSESNDGGKDMLDLKKEKEEKQPEEVRSFEAWLRGEQRDLTTGQTTTNSDAVLPSQVLDLLKQPNDPTQLASYVNRVGVSAGTGKLPVLAKATARLATTAELKVNPDVAEATITKVPYDLETYRGQLPISNEMIQDYPNITSLLTEYVNYVKNATEQTEIGKVLQTATAKSAQSLDDIKDLYNGLLNYGKDRKFVVTASMFNELDTMKDAEGRYLLKEDITAETGRTLFGAELIIVPDEILGTSGDKKMFIGSLKAFITEAVKGEVTMRWEENTNFENVLGVAIRMDVVAGDSASGYFVTYAEPSK